MDRYNVGGSSNRDQSEDNARQADIRGTRIAVELLLRKLGEGASEHDLLEAYPQLTKEDIQAAITYAADTLAHEETFPVESKR